MALGHDRDMPKPPAIEPPDNSTDPNTPEVPDEETMPLEGSEPTASADASTSSATESAQRPDSEVSDRQRPTLVAEERSRALEHLEHAGTHVADVFLDGGLDRVVVLRDDRRREHEVLLRARLETGLQ